MILGIAVVLLAAACGSDNNDDSGSTSSTAEPADDDESADDESAVPDEASDADDSTTADPPPAAGESALTSTVADSWTAVSIGAGTKPSLELDANGDPAIAFLFEDVPEGFVAYASAADDWTVDALTEGYFYGPIGLAFDLDNRPNIAFHDHQASSFNQQLGDLTHAVRDGTEWQVGAAASEGHDGWDSTIVIGADGVVRAAGVDPSQFDRDPGVEYYELVDGEWIVEEIGSGPTEYEWNVDLQVATDGTVAMTYFANSTSDLIFASRAPGGTWTLETVVSDGDVGRFSSFAFDDDGAAHISYWNADTGEVIYAGNSTGTWETSTIAVLDSVQPGFEGARRITSLDLGPDGEVVIAYSDTTGVWLARLSTDGSWAIEQVVTAGDLPLGQLVTLAVDDGGVPHLSYFEVIANGPLTGEVVYATTG